MTARWYQKPFVRAIPVPRLVTSFTLKYPHAFEVWAWISPSVHGWRMKFRRWNLLNRFYPGSLAKLERISGDWLPRTELFPLSSRPKAAFKLLLLVKAGREEARRGPGHSSALLRPSGKDSAPCTGRLMNSFMQVWGWGCSRKMVMWRMSKNQPWQKGKGKMYEGLSDLARS